MQETAVQKPDSAMQPEHWYDALPRPAYASLERVPVTEDWFEVYRIQPDLYAIYEPGHFQEVISYLITKERLTSPSIESDFWTISVKRPCWWIPDSAWGISARWWRSSPACRFL